MGMAPTFLYTSLNGANNFFAKANRHNAATLLNYHDLCISSNEQLFDKILNFNLPRPYPTDTIATIHCTELHSQK